MISIAAHTVLSNNKGRGGHDSPHPFFDHVAAHLATRGPDHMQHNNMRQKSETHATYNTTNTNVPCEGVVSVLSLLVLQLDRADVRRAQFGGERTRIDVGPHQLVDQTLNNNDNDNEQHTQTE